MELELSDGSLAHIDRADIKLVKPYRWHAHSEGYVCGNGGRILLHRLIMDAPKGVPVDHRDGDKRNNRRRNLRLATYAVNARNRVHATRVPGIRFKQGRFSVYLYINYKYVYIGSVSTEREAIELRATAELNQFNELSPATARALNRR